MSRAQRTDQLSPAAEQRTAIVTAPFFVMRTPLLPFDDLLAWSAGLAASSALDDMTHLESSLAEDRAVLRQRLRTLVERPDVREALFLASPDLDESIPFWIDDPHSERGQKVERSLVRYVARMAGRATPFGLFAGWSVGGVAGRTRLTVAPATAIQRHTRIDMDYLFELAEGLGRDEALRDNWRYVPNSSLYRIGGSLRYAEARVVGRARSYHLVAVQTTEELQATLERATSGARAADLAQTLVEHDSELTPRQARAFIDELITSQILVPDVAPNVTGAEPIHGMISRLRTHATSAPIAHTLEQTRDALVAIDFDGPGVAPDRYRAVAALLDCLPATPKLARLFQVDMARPAQDLMLGTALLAEVERGVHLLHRLAEGTSDALATFRAAFTARYDGREVPLVEVLDEEFGIGFASGRTRGADAAPLLGGLAFPGAGGEPTTTWGRRQALLLQKLEAAAWNGAQTIELTAADLDTLATSHPSPLPSSLAVMATIAAAPADCVTAEDAQILIHGVVGPSGARLLGRFCHADPALHEHVERLLRAEESAEPDALYAEVVHLPEGRIGNVLCRPALRQYEIPYLGRSGVPSSQQIAASDLLVSVAGERIILRSARLKRRVIPRLSSAHNYAFGLPLYRFICLLQGQDVSGGLGWNWGPFDNAAFLPRVTSGRIVLARARWRLGREDLQRIGELRDAARFQAVQELRQSSKLPRHVLLSDGDNELPVDLDNVLSIDTFVELVKGRGEARLVEMFPAPDDLCARGADGRFVHELVIPFMRQAAPAPERAPHPAAQPAVKPRLPHIQRRFVLGSEWLFAKFYSGTATSDRVLRDVVAPLVTAGEHAGAIDGWFFIRYNDPEAHLRVRLHGPAERLCAEVLPALQRAAAPFLDDNRIWRMQFDTYEREVERYAGPAGIALAEQIFCTDSRAVLAIVKTLTGDSGSDGRWRLALAGMDRLLDDLGFDLAGKRAIITRTSAAYAQEFHVDRILLRQVGDKFRQQRARLERLLDPDDATRRVFGPGFAAFEQRSAQLQPVVAALRHLEASGSLTSSLADLAPSLLHMHANRLLRSTQRAQELVLYDFLDRLYESRHARLRSHK